jgi:hypothetical protein
MLVPRGKPLLGDFRARAGLILAACAIVTWPCFWTSSKAP